MSFNKSEKLKKNENRMHDFQSNRIVNPSNESQEKKKQEEKILYKASMHKRAYQNHYKIIEMRYTIKSRKESQICTHKHTHIH